MECLRTTCAAISSEPRPFPIAAEISSSGAFAPEGNWKYLDDGTQLRLKPGPPWYAPEFNDSAWPTGKGWLGYGDPTATTIGYGLAANARYITTYLRQIFAVSDAASISQLLLPVLRDDGVVVYLNGHEVLRMNMPTGPIDDLTLAASSIKGTAEEEYATRSVDPTFLVDGVNWIAVELHQASSSNLDVRFDLFLETNPTLSTPPSQPPQVAILNPIGGQSFPYPADIDINRLVNAADSDGVVTNVDFYVRSAKSGVGYA